MKDGEPALTRIGVGNHLILGGDNMDLALAHLAESRLGEPQRQCHASDQRKRGNRLLFEQ